jgi:hypothetical protein
MKKMKTHTMAPSYNVVLLIASLCSVLELIVPAESQCSCMFRLPLLRALYDATEGAQWVLPWNFSSADAPCFFNGVTCSSSGITNITLFNQSLRGHLPAALANLTELVVFNVSSNNISGTLPKEYAQWYATLNKFVVNNNLISSTLPKPYSSWGSSIKYARFHDCDIYGTLPAEYSMWSNINIFSVSNSRLNGTLPPQYGAWATIGMIVVSSTSLSGTIPASYKTWQNVTTIDWSGNQLSGTIPSTLWGGMTELNAIALSKSCCRSPH